MWAPLLLWPLALGSRLEGGTPTPSVYDEDWSTGGGDGVQRGPWTTPRGPAGCLPRSFPGRLCPNGSNTLELPESSQALLLGWVATRMVPALYGLALVVGLPANGLALWVLATRVPRLPSTLLLMNLAAADLLLALTLPPRIAYHLRGQRWPFGEAACRLDTAALYGHMYCSMLLLAAISLDRYLAVVHPLRARALRGRCLATGLCTAAWLVAATLVLPLGLRQQTFGLPGSDRLLCHDALPLDAQASYWRPTFICLAVVGCLLPLLATLLCYGATLCSLATEGQRYCHALRLTALVLASALAFFAPSNVLLLLHYSDPGPEDWGNLYAAYMLSLAFSTLNSCVDPFIYYYVSTEFRDKVREALLCWVPVSTTVSKERGSPATGTRSSSLV
ncbi:proteinase-activated receptor 4 [Pipistrellus kuhlii]|uniref:Proteinase-activated receptor 4 n=1 Tax=Pipistrellus kuhlii TaxID=59472 RepID=A0A7J7S481_PIPKU|nr:proteinase-activated receptor 4 [Pipistrellus kuhlii]KAF6283262.1 F2R like thrombin or trypsin receptor 3 [Pipistrellus kuhlii]